MADSYFTVRSGAEVSGEAQAHQAAMRARHYDARHTVPALILVDGTERASEDGEPQRTRGMPTLEVLRGAGLKDVCCVTTRYFGGTLLGPGGLGRAYAAAAQAAVVRARHYDARHTVPALILVDGTERASEDGEPQRTRGMPTLEVLRGAGLKDVCCVTTRYFGGTLLGPGGLGRAYAAAAQAAVEAARSAGDIVEMTSVVNVDVPVAYPLIHAIYREGEHEALRPLLTELMAGKEVVEVGKAHFDEF